MARKKAALPPLPEPWDEDVDIEHHEIDPGWAPLIYAWNDGHKRPLIEALRGHDRIPTDDRVLRNFLADFLEGKIKGQRGRRAGRRTFVIGLDGKPAWAPESQAKNYAAAAWMRARQRERGDRQRVHALVEAANKFELDVAAFENWLDKPLKRRR